MPVIYTTYILLAIGIILIISGQILNKKKLIISGVISLILIFVLWFVIVIWGSIEEEGKRNIAFSNNNTNNNTIVDNSTALGNTTIDGITNITSDFLNDYLYLNGKITKVKDNKIYILDKGNKEYILENNEQTKYIDGRTGVNYSFNDITKNYYIHINSYDKICYLFKDIEGEELKKELLISLSLPDSVKMVRTSIDEIIEIEQLGNNEAIITFSISDIIWSEYYPGVNDEKHKFIVKFKATNNTKYESKGRYTYDANTIENSKCTILVIKLDENTLNNEYPEIREFLSSDS